DRTGTSVLDGLGTSFGNLSDGIFILYPNAASGSQSPLLASVAIVGNTVSNNDGAGIHAVAGTAITGGVLTITGNRIGTDPTGTIIKTSSTSHGFGNGADGIFLVGFPETDGRTPLVTVGSNTISGNLSNGVDLLSSHQVLIVGNKIGTNAV